jgi:hypothetical protein
VIDARLERLRTAASAVDDQTLETFLDELSRS